jgi:hypothetical protein
MNRPTSSSSDGSRKNPWYLLWVLGAIGLAIFNAAEYLSTPKVSSVLLALAWAGLALSWYMKPFAVNFGVKFSEVISAQPVRPAVPLPLWNAVTLVAVGLLVVGVVLKHVSTA